MWLFTKYGFFSAVCAREGDGKYGRPVDENRIMVRARSKEHLLALIQRFGAHLGESEILDSAGTDYRYRIFVDKDRWSAVIGDLASETDYDNFKSAVATHQGADGREYEMALHDVWSVMHHLQR